MDNEGKHHRTENENAASFFNDKASSSVEQSTIGPGPQISFAPPNHGPVQPPLPSRGPASENGLPAPTRARRHFEHSAQGLPPLFSLHGPGHFGNPATPTPISPLSLFSPRTGFPGLLLPPIRGDLNDIPRMEGAPLTPLSPMNFTPVLRSPMDQLRPPMEQFRSQMDQFRSPMHHGDGRRQMGSMFRSMNATAAGSSHHAANDNVRRHGSHALSSESVHADSERRMHDSTDLNELNRIGFSRQLDGHASNASLLGGNERVSTWIADNRPARASQDLGLDLRDTPHSNNQGVSEVMEAAGPSHPLVQLNDILDSSAELRRGPDLHPSGQFHSNLLQNPGPPPSNMTPSTQRMESSAFQEIPHNLSSNSLAPAEPPSHPQIIGDIHPGNYLNSRYRHGSSAGILSSAHNPTSHINLATVAAQPDRMDVVEDGRTPLIKNRQGQADTLRVLPPIIIDRPLVRKAEVLEQKIARSGYFETFVFGLKQSHQLKGDDACGGTGRRRSDLIKPVVNVDDFGYPASDRVDIHTCLDNMPGVTRENVEYMKSILHSQLETVKRAAREALYQSAILLVDQLRYRVMKKEDILSLQCSVVDRFVVARKCILEKYTQYVRSRRWIENMSTNQRRGCLNHRQNNMLRMWLYQNFTDPYPDDEAKEMLMKETELSLDQVNNWLINARSRFWKPTMDCFGRASLERKIVMLIRRRMVMTTEQKIKAVSSVPLSD